MQAVSFAPSALTSAASSLAASKSISSTPVEVSSQRFARKAILKEGAFTPNGTLNGASNSELRQANRYEPGFWGTLNRMANAMLVIDLFQLLASVGSAAFGWLHHFF